MATLRFRAAIEINGINPYVPVSAARAARLRKDWRKPMPVRIRVNSKPDTAWRINMMPRGDGSFYLYLHGDVRKAAAADVGDIVAVEVSFDETYCGGPIDAMPVWFSAALRKDRNARRGWDALIPSRQKEILRYLTRLKSPQAQQRNLHKVLHVLGGSETRFMARSWNTKTGA